MAPPKTSRPLKKDLFPSTFKGIKPTVLAETGRPTGLAPNIRSLSWSPTGNAIATSISSYIRVWNPERPNVKSSTELRAGGTAMVEKVAFCPTQEAVLASTGGDGLCRLWDVRVGSGGGVAGGKGRVLEECKTGDTGLFLNWHPSGSTVLVGRKDDVVMAVDVRKMEPAEGGSGWAVEARDSSPVKDRGQFNAMAFSNSGRELFATTGEGPVKVLDWPSLECLYTLSAHTSATYAVQHSPAGSYVAVGGSDSMITLWDTTNWHCAHTLTPHMGSVRDLSFSFDGAYIAGSSGSDARDSTPGIEVCHVDTGEHVHTIETSNPVTWLAWHPLRYWLAYAGDPGGLRIVGAGTSV
jgi:THO complex subunit 3